MVQRNGHTSGVSKGESPQSTQGVHLTGDRNRAGDDEMATATVAPTRPATGNVQPKAPAHPPRPAAGAAPAEAPAPEQTQQAKPISAGARRYVINREATRKIQVHAPRRIAASIDEAVVLTSKSKKPDMRFAENRLMFGVAPDVRKDGKPDQRFVEQRPDILALHEQRGEHSPGVLFDEDGRMPEGVAGATLEAGQAIELTDE